MCRNKDERLERCECAKGARRSAFDRATTAAKKAAAATKALTGRLGRPAAPIVPSVAQINDLAAQVGFVYGDPWPYMGSDPGRFVAANFDTQCDAVLAVGDQVAERAEMHAGITGEAVRESYQAREAAAAEELAAATVLTEAGHKRWLRAVRLNMVTADDDPRKLEYEADVLAKQDANVALMESTGINVKQTHLWDIQNLRDTETRDDLAKLSAGYSQALAEIRETGGQMIWDSRSSDDATTAFDEASSVYPSEWIARSNIREAPIASVSAERAHYTQSVGQISPRVIQPTRPTLREESRPPVDTAVSTYVLDPDGPRQGTRVTYQKTSWDIAEDVPSADPAPAGDGWQRFDIDDERGWRRVSQPYVIEEMTHAPEIRTNHDPASGPTAGRTLPGRSNTFAVSVHELSHRMEHSVSGLKEMEEDFLVRRTTTGGQRDELVELYEGSGEYARPDNFVSGYMGKDYSTGFREVLSCGTQGIFGGDYGGLVGVGKDHPDPEYRSFILGALACAGRPTRDTGGAS